MRFYTELEAQNTESFFVMFSDKLLSPVSKQSVSLATFFQFEREYIEALLQKHLLCQSKTGGLGLCFTVLFFLSF